LQAKAAAFFEMEKAATNFGGYEKATKLKQRKVVHITPATLHMLNYEASSGHAGEN
jgi:hypothetical protein